MKKYLLLTAAIIYSTANFAQLLNAKHDPKNLDPLTRSILQKQYTKDNNIVRYKTTGTNKRLIATAYRFNGEVTDTSHYYYSAGRGSDLSDPGSYTDNYYPTTYADVQVIHSDSSINWGSNGGPLTIQSYRAYAYGKVKPVQMDYIYGGSYIHYDMTYIDDTTRETVIQSDTFGGSILSPKYTIYFNYNLNGWHTHDSLVSNIINTEVAKTEFKQDVNGNLLTYDYYNLLGVNWIQTYHMEYAYDGSNRIISVLTQNYGNGGLVNDYKDTFIYNGSSTHYSEMYYYTWDNTNMLWAPYYNYVNTYNANGFIDTNILMSYSTQWDTLYKAVYVYDNAGLLCQNLYSYPYLGNGSFSTTASDTQTYYYEEYFPTNIKSPSTTGIGINIYPNPSTNAITLDIPTSGLGNVSIMNATGQLLYKSEHISLNKQTIDIHQLPKGNYILMVQDDKERHIYQRQFVKI